MKVGDLVQILIHGKDWGTGLILEPWPDRKNSNEAKAFRILLENGTVKTRLRKSLKVIK